MSFPRYPDYKDSGVAWLGEVPRHWTELRAKSAFREIDERSSDGSEELLKVSHITGVTSRNEKNFNMIMAESLDGYKKCLPGDLVINTMWAWMGALGTSRLVGIVSPSYNVYRPDSSYIVSEFFDYLCRIPQFSTEVKSRSTGVWESRLRLYPEAFLSIRFAIPSLPEQFSIVAFLDRETVKIDALVVEQERLIELLKEKRQAIISHAVTKGLNPDVPMKDSGIEWLGKVPEHWQVGPVKRFFSVLDGRRIPLSAEERGSRNGEYPYYGASGIIDFVDDWIFDEDLILVSEDGANLINRSTPISFVARGKYWVNNHAHILKPIDDALTYWSERIEAVDLFPFVTGSAQPKLTIDALANILIAVPPCSEERKAIEIYILEAAVRAEALITEAQRAIDVLKERRAALISAAVTGRIDVRGLVADNHASAERAPA